MTTTFSLNFVMHATGLQYHSATERLKKYKDGRITKEQLLSPKNSPLIRVYQSKLANGEKNKMRWFTYQDYKSKKE